MTFFSVARVCHGHGGGCGVRSETCRSWDSAGIGRDSRRLSSVLGLFALCAAPLLVCVHGSPVMNAGLKLLGGSFCMGYAGLYAVFESLERPALLSLPRSELLKHQLLQ